MLLRSRGGRVLKGPRLAPGAAPPHIPGGCLGSGAPGFSLPLAGAPQLLEVWALRHGKLYGVGKLLLRAVQNGPTRTLWGSSSLRFTSCSLHKPGLCSSKQGQSEGNFCFFLYCWKATLRTPVGRMKSQCVLQSQRWVLPVALSSPFCPAMYSKKPKRTQTW